MQQPQILPSEPRSGVIRNPETPDPQAGYLFLHSQKHQRRRFWARLEHCSTGRYHSRAGCVEWISWMRTVREEGVRLFGRLAVL